MLLSTEDYRSIRIRVCDDLQTAVVSPSNDDLTVVTGLKATYLVLIFPYFDLSFQTQERQLPDEQLFLRIKVDLNKIKKLQGIKWNL